MADTKISALTETTSPAYNDMIPIVTVGDGVTKRMSFATMRSHPYGCVSDSTTQTIANVSIAYPITFNTNEVLSNITHSETVNPSQITVPIAGVYLITFSAIAKSAAPNKYVDIWLAVQGSPVTRSNTISRFVGTSNERIITVTYVYTFTAGQYFELMWHSDDTGTTLPATGTQSSPTRPACPSIILTINMVSAA